MNKTKSYYINDSSQDNLLSRISRSLSGVFMNSLQIIVIVGLILILLYLFVFPINVVQGNSMVPNFCNGDVYVTYKLGNFVEKQPYKRGDVISFKANNNTSFIKRVIGIPGDEVAIIQGKVYVNGVPIEEPYLPQGTFTRVNSAGVLSEGQIIKVERRSYFVLGDNRAVSFDSRNIGVINMDANAINGKVILIIWPLDRFRIFDNNELLPNKCNVNV